MKKFVSLDKRSKKAQKEYHSKQRLTWGVLNPVTRSVPSGKTYNREKDKQERRRIGKEFSDGFEADFFVVLIDMTLTNDITISIIPNIKNVI